MPDTQISELLVRINKWLREPDYAENFSLTDMADWMNRRPLALMGQATAALSSYAVVPREPLNNLVGRLRFEREINKQRISGTDWNFYLEPLGFPAPQMERG